MECPHCRETLAGLNPAADVALCRACGRVSRLSDRVAKEEAGLGMVGMDTPPPRGCHAEPTVAGRAWVCRVFRPGVALPFTLMAIFWNAVLSVFLWHLGRMAGPLLGFGPPGRPAAASNWLGVCVMAAFLVPFVWSGLRLAATPLFCLLGTVRVSVEASEGRVRSGVGPLGRTRRFDPREVEALGLSFGGRSGEGRGSPVLEIRLLGGRRVRFGERLRERQLAWLLGGLREHLPRPPGAR